MCLWYVGCEEEVVEFLCCVYLCDVKFILVCEVLDNFNFWLIFIDLEMIEVCIDLWDLDSVLICVQIEVVCYVEMVVKYLVEGDVEFNVMFGMEQVKKEIKFIKLMMKVNLVCVKMGFLVLVMLCYILLFGLFGIGKILVVRVFIKQLCGLIVLCKLLVVEISCIKLLGWYMVDVEKNIEEMFEGVLGGVVFFDEMYILYEKGYFQGDLYGNVIINMLLLYMENYCDELVVFGVGYVKVMEKMFEVNQGLCWCFLMVIEFFSYILQELIVLIQLMGWENEDVIIEEEF